MHLRERKKLLAAVVLLVLSAVFSVMLDFY